MTYEEAWKINAEYRTSWVIAKHKDKPLNEEYEEYINEKITYHNIIQNALEKQIPKKPLDYDDCEQFYIQCPSCKKIYDSRFGYKGCPYCLQAIDWSD